MARHITKDLLVEHAQHFLDALERKNIQNEEDLEEAKHPAGMVAYATENTSLMITYQPSQGTSHAYVFSYWLKGEPRPIMEVRMNVDKDYSTLLVTCDEKLAGFEAFDRNEIGDFLEDKKLLGGNLSSVKELLESL